jgi:hypothetical protein
MEKGDKDTNPNIVENKARKFYQNYIKNEQSFKTELPELIKSKNWKDFISEIDSVYNLFKEYYVGDQFFRLTGDDSLSYKYDFIDYLQTLTEIESPSKYRVKIEQIINDIELLEKSYRLNCHDILKCHTNFDMDSPEVNFYKQDFIKNDSWKMEMETKLKEKHGVEIFDYDLVKNIISYFHDIRISFINIMVFCTKEYTAKSELFNTNTEILTKINRLNDSLAEFTNKCLSMSRKEIINTKSLILAITDEFYKNLRTYYNIDFTRSYYNIRLEKFKFEIERLSLVNLEEATLFDFMPHTLQKELKFSKKEKIIFHLLFIKFGDSNYGLQRVWRFLKENKNELGISFKMTLKKFNSFIKDHYKLNYKTSDSQKTHGYNKSDKFEMQNYLKNNSLDVKN